MSILPLQPLKSPRINVYLLSLVFCLEDSVKPHIELVKHRYSGGVLPDGHGDFTVDPEGQIYVADPSPEVDNAWEALQVGASLLQITFIFMCHVS